MTSYSTIIKLDDGTGTFPHTVTSLVRSWSYSQGRNDEMAQVEAGTCSIVFDNTGGEFTVGNGTYGFALGQRVLVQMTDGTTTWNRFAGLLDTAPVVWTSSNGLSSMVTATFTDLMVLMSRRTFDSALVESLGTADLLWKLGGPTGSAAVEGSGNNGPSLVSAGGGAGPAPVLGVDAAPGVDGQTCAKFTAGQYYYTASGLSLDLDAGIWLSCWFKTSYSGVQQGVLGAKQLQSNGALALSVSLFGSTLHATWENQDGTVGVADLTHTPAGSGYADGNWHHVAVFTSATDVKLYTDGVLRADDSVFLAQAPGNRFTRINVGNSGTGDRLPNITGDVAYVAMHTAAHAPDWAFVYRAGVAWLGATSTAAFSDLCTMASVPSPVISGTASNTSLPAFSIAGSNALDAMRTVVNGEGGLLLGTPTAGGVPTLRMITRSAAASAASGTPAALGNGDVEDNLTFAMDRQLYYNKVTASRVNGTSLTRSDPTAIASIGEYSTSLDGVAVATDQQASDLLDWFWVAHNTLDPKRVAQVTVDLLTYAASSGSASSLLGAGIATPLTLAGLPTQAPGTSVALLIEGITEQWSADEWQITFNTAPQQVATAWILGDSTYGVLGSTTKLFY